MIRVTPLCRYSLPRLPSPVAVAKKVVEPETMSFDTEEQER
jgi:hypothetical protein